MRFRHLSIDQGLSQSTVTALEVDHQGFLWVGTLDGFNRYSGNRFKTFGVDPTDPRRLPYGQVRGFAEDSAGRLWIASRGGLSLLDRATFDIEHFDRVADGMGTESSVVSSVIEAILTDGTNHLWLGTGAGLDLFDTTTRQVVRSFEDNPITGTKGDPFRIKSLYLGDDGTLYVGAETGLALLRPGAAELEALLFPCAGSEVRAIQEDQAGGLWVATLGNGACFRPAGGGDWRQFRHDLEREESLAHDSVFSLLIDDAGKLWLGTESGLDRFDPKAGSFEHIRQREGARGGLESDSVTALAQDRQGAIWAGTSDGLFRVAPTSFDSYLGSGTAEGLASPRTWSVFEEMDGTLWVGTLAGLSRRDPKTGLFQHFHHDPRDRASLPPSAVRVIADAGDGRLWIGTGTGGLARCSKAEVRCEHFRFEAGDKASLPNDSVRGLAVDRNGDLWVATFGGVARYLVRQGRFERFVHREGDEQSLASTAAYAVLADSSGAIWVSLLGQGVDRIEPTSGEIEHFPPPKENFVGNVVSLAERGDGLWLGTFDGAFRLDVASKKWEAFSPPGLVRGPVYAVLEDRRGRIWLPTNNGLGCCSKDASGCQWFGPGDGLLSAEFNGGAALVGLNGRFFLGGPRGLQSFDPLAIRGNSEPPPVVITEIDLFDRQVPLPDDGLFELAWEDRHLAIEFAALNFDQPEKNRYAYQLEGVDPDWIAAGSRNEARYTNLEPGKYLFRVKAANNAGVWNEEGASLTIHVVPPWWRNPAFRLLLAISVFALIASVVSWRIVALKAANQRLEKRVVERTGALSATIANLEASEREALQAKEEALEASRAKAAFLANMSHEIRTPMNAVIGMTGVLLGTRLEERQLSFVETIRKSGNSLLALINDILDFSKIESGRFELERITFRLRDLVEESVALLFPQAMTKGLLLHAEIATELPEYLEQDETRLRQVLINLLGNAVKFTEKGSVLLEVSGKPLPGRRFELLFTVRDTGIGIPRERQPHLFEPFSQGDNSITRRYGGTGLGLAISKHLVENMGGKIELESERGRGATFEFTIVAGIGTPTQFGELARRDESPKAISKTQFAKLRVLLAEDNSVNQMVQLAMLEQLGIRADVAATGLEALEALERQDYDLVLMDVQMPEMDGITATRLLRQRVGRDHLPIIVAVTAGAFEADRERCLEAGMNDFLSKPVRLESIAALLERWLPKLEAQG